MLFSGKEIPEITSDEMKIMFKYQQTKEERNHHNDRVWNGKNMLG